MTDDRQAVKTLAEQLVKAMKSVSANTPSKYVNDRGSFTGTIQASKIVGLPAAFSSIISGVESSAAGGDAIAQQTLIALNHIAAGEFETITADTAMIEKVYATFGDFITLVAEDAQIGSLDVETIRAGLAEVGLINIGTASIDMAQIKRSSTQTAFIHESVQGKVYIDDLAVNDASIVNLSAGTVLINDNNGNLVELYVDSQGDVSTRAVSYDGSDIINQNSLSGNTIINDTLSGDAVIANSLNGNKIIANSITTTQLNANEIFAAQGTIMDLIADNIEATRLFANQGFITELQSTIISSDLSENSTVIELTDSINLFASNASRTFIQDSMPIPTHTSDTWFDPSTEEHYVANAIYLPISQMLFGADENGILYNEHSDDFSFSMNSNGELMLLVTNETAEEIILDNNINFRIANDRLYADGLWEKIDNIAFSNLKVSVDGIVSEVYDSNTGESRIAQNADRIVAIVAGDTSVPYVKTSSIEIKEDKVEIKSTGDVDIKADNFSISFNTSGSAANRNRVDISNTLGIKVSDQYGGYFQATYDKLGLYDSAGNAKLYMNSLGNAVFTGSITGGTINGASLTLGGAGNVSGSLTVKDANDNPIGTWDNNGITINSGSITGGTINGASLTLGGAGNASGTLTVYDSGTATTRKKRVEINNSGIAVYKSDGTTKQFYIDSTTGNATFAGSITGGTINGASLTLGGAGNASGSLVVNDADGNPIVTLDRTGIEITKGNIELDSNYLVRVGEFRTSGTYAELNSTGIKVNVRNNEISTRISASINQSYSASYPSGITVSYYPLSFIYNSLDNTYLWNNYVSPFGMEIFTEHYAKRWHAYYNVSEQIIREYEKISGVWTQGRTYELHLGDSMYTDQIAFSGTKSRIVSTDQYSNRLLYCYETPSPMFGDIGDGIISEDGMCYISLDPIFAQTISTDDYQVFLQKYGEGDCYVSERHGSYFVVSGTPNLSFGWELKAKQLDYDQLRLEKNDAKFVVPNQSYGEDAASHIKDLYNERTQQNEQSIQESEEIINE